MQGLCLFNDVESMSRILWYIERDQRRLTMNVAKEYIFSQGTDRKPLVRIMAYCVMDNHFHLLVEEIQEGGITKFMQKLGVGYAKYFNHKYDRVGSLFQGKFKNTLVDNDRYLEYLLVYINVLNPAQRVHPNFKEEGTKDVKKTLGYVENYPWSTHQEYLGKRNSIIIDKGILGKMLPTPEAYLDLVRGVLEGKKYEGIGRLVEFE